MDNKKPITDKETFLKALANFSEKNKNRIRDNREHEFLNKNKIDLYRSKNQVSGLSPLSDEVNKVLGKGEENISDIKQVKASPFDDARIRTNDPMIVKSNQPAIDEAKQSLLVKGGQKENFNIQNEPMKVARIPGTTDNPIEDKIKSVTAEEFKQKAQERQIMNKLDATLAHAAKNNDTETIRKITAIKSAMANKLKSVLPIVGPALVAGTALNSSDASATDLIPGLSSVESMGPIKGSEEYKQEVPSKEKILTRPESINYSSGNQEETDALKQAKQRMDKLAILRKMVRN